jgi:hypothetical protein
MEESVGKLWGDNDQGEFGPVGLYGLSVGLQWLRLVSFLLVQRELGQVNYGRKPSREAGCLDFVYLPNHLSTVTFISATFSCNPAVLSLLRYSLQPSRLIHDPSPPLPPKMQLGNHNGDLPHTHLLALLSPTTFSTTLSSPGMGRGRSGGALCGILTARMQSSCYPCLLEKNPFVRLRKKYQPDMGSARSLQLNIYWRACSLCG